MRCQMLAALLDLCPAFGTSSDLQRDKCGWVGTEINKQEESENGLKKANCIHFLATKHYV